MRSDKLQDLMRKIDQLTDELLAKAQRQQHEIDRLKHENEQLRTLTEKTLAEVEGHVAELEKIKKSLCQ